MPQNVRNFWIEADIDGCKTRITGGPVVRDGGIKLTVFMRDNGEVKQALVITGRALSDGRLILEAGTATLGGSVAEFGTLGDDNSGGELSVSSKR